MTSAYIRIIEKKLETTILYDRVFDGLHESPVWADSEKVGILH